MHSRDHANSEYASYVM